MPSPIGHAIAGAAAGWLVAGAPPLAPFTRKAPGAFPATVPAIFWREAMLFGALGALPDLDLLFGPHRGPTHSLGASVAVAIIVVLGAVISGSIAPRAATGAPQAAGRGPVMLGLACGAAYASHVLLDWLGRDNSPPIGVMALWPFDREYYASSVHLFIAISRRYQQGWRFVAMNAAAVAWELMILLPLLALVVKTRTRREPRR